MFKALLSFFKKPRNKYDFELANLKDLSVYSFDELSSLLKNFEYVISIENDVISAKFESKYSFLEVQYTISGEFIKIVDQYWK
jgi:hypothetical protein